MQAQDSSTILAEINAHIQKSGISNSGWYAGITSDVDQRLFGDHRVPRQNHWFIYRRAINSDQARAVEAAYHKVGIQGRQWRMVDEEDNITYSTYTITPTSCSCGEQPACRRIGIRLIGDIGSVYAAELWTA